MKFRLKIALAMMALLALIFGIGGALFISLSFNDTLSREESDATASYKTILAVLQRTGSSDLMLVDTESAQLLNQLADQDAGGWSALRVSARIPQEAGEAQTSVIYDYNNQTISLAESLADETFQPSAGRATCHFVQMSNSMYVLLFKATVNSQNGYLDITLVKDASAVFAVRKEQLQIFWLVFGLMIVLCLGLSYVTARMLTSPMSRLSDTANAIAAGNLSERADVHTNDEVGDLANDFNRMAEAQEHTISQLEEASERQSLFIGSVAHELKTPMTSIIGYGDLIQSTNLTENERAEAAAYIVSEGKRLESLSGKLLELIVIKNAQVQRVSASPAELAANVVDGLRPAYQADGITLSLEAEVGMRQLEPDLFSSLLFNLIDNARKAIDKEGSIAVTLSLIEDGVVVEVADTGRGMSEEARARATETFYREDASRSRKSGGAGLGLSLCKLIVDAHAGSLEFLANNPVGTKVRVVLREGGDGV